MTDHKNTHLISVAPLIRIAMTRDQSFFYTFSRALSIGTLVSISIGQRVVHGIVTQSHKDFPRKSSYEIKRITHIIEESYLSHTQLTIANFISSYYLCPLGLVLTHFLTQRTVSRSHAEQQIIKPIHHNIHTTFDQKKIINSLAADHGFRHVILQAPIAEDKLTILIGYIMNILHNSHNQVLYLTPELIHIPHITRFFMEFFGNESIAIMHGKISKSEQYANWNNIRSGKARIIIGTRKAIFSPFRTLEAIIIDESHDQSYKQWDHYPLYDARTVSHELARLHQCMIVTVSGTLRTSDYHCIKKPDTQVRFITAPEKITTRIIVVDMKKERWDKHFSPISRTLLGHISLMIKNKKQVLLFVNHQGESTFSICSKCRMIPKCPKCDRALIRSGEKTYHCIHCKHTAPEYNQCTTCNAPMQHIGIGTKKIEKELKKMLPLARIAIVDSSTMKNLRTYENIYSDFREHAIDVVIGTQMITKNWSSGNIGLSCIIDMDHLLCLPSYDVNEKAFAFAMQLASRAHNGTLLIQTFQPEHSVIKCAQTHDFNTFHSAELILRETLLYPPFSQLIKMVYKDSDRERVDRESDRMFQSLLSLSLHDHLRISEPHYPLVDTVRKKFIKQIIIKSTYDTLPTELTTLFTHCDRRWSIDIDPSSII